jgi:hypothetical protein
VAQTFFCLLVVMSLFTGRGWLESTRTASPEARTIFRLSGASLAALYLQLFFGAAFRHGGMSIVYHIFNSVVVTALLLAASVRGMIAGRNAMPRLRTAARVVHYLLWIQIALGITAYITRVKWGAEAPQPLPSMVASTVAHLGVGALLLAATFVLAIEAHAHAAAAETKPARAMEAGIPA